ncbi:MAG: rhodanese-like domain-containing protein [Candidatus Sericytochromatia bacterium]
MLKRSFLTLLTAVSLGACRQQVPQFEVAPQQAQALRQQITGLQVLDVRTTAEFNGGHLANAEQIDFNGPNFAEQISGLDKQAPYLIYCATGRRSALARQQMLDQGFQQVYDMRGGFEAWKTSGLPSER